MPAALLLLALTAGAQTAKPEAFVYSTMPSLWDNRPELAMDGDPKTAFRSYYGMEQDDTFTVIFSRSVAAKSIVIKTGDDNGEDRLSDADLQISEDGTTFRRVLAFKGGDLEFKRDGHALAAIRIGMNKGKAAPHLVIREITVDGTSIHALRGPGRAFTELNGNTDLAAWAQKAERQMEAFWPDAQALLYSKGFVTPNAVNVMYESGPDVTPVAATGGGKMQVNTAWCRAHPDDTGLTVHEMAHVVQSGGAPGWLIEAVADYIRWVRFEPQNFTFRIDPAKATPHDPYRTGAAFLGWCENHYDPRLVTKLNDAARFGRYSDALFERYCGKPIETLWSEFMADYQKDPKGVLNPPLPESMRPRPLPTATFSLPVEMAYTTVGVYKDGSTFRPNGGFDDGGAAYAAAPLGRTVRTNGVTFNLAPAEAADVLIARGQTLKLSGKHKSFWLLGSSIEGSQRDQAVVFTYDDGTTTKIEQNFSDWYTPETFPGEVRALRMPYRVMANGSRDERPFNVYAYGFSLDGTKTLRSVTLPNNPNIRILAASVGD
jgi:hypothetical protein